MIRSPRIALLIVLVVLPSLLGAVCTRRSIGVPFARIEFSQSDGCLDLDLPAAIAVTKLDDGAYSLDVAEIIIDEAFADDRAGCSNARGAFIDGECHVEGPTTMRLLTAEEMQRVDEVVARLEDEASLETARFCAVNAVDPCGKVTMRINDHLFELNPCPNFGDRLLAAESREALRMLWLSLR